MHEGNKDISFLNGKREEEERESRERESERKKKLRLSTTQREIKKKIRENR